MTRDELRIFFTERGWNLNRTGTSYIRPDVPNTRYRVKQLALRKEQRMGDGGWFRLSSGYISGLTIINGKLAGMKR